MDECAGSFSSNGNISYNQTLYLIIHEIYISLKFYTVIASEKCTLFTEPSAYEEICRL